MADLVTGLAALPPLLILLTAALLPALEASALIGLVIPGETAVFVAGVTVRTGHLPLWAVIAAAAVGAVAGDQVGYQLGRRWGPRMLDRLPHRLRRHRSIDHALALIARRGGWAVLIGRWTALMRALMPGLAGSVGLPRNTFTVYTLVGGLVWAAVVASVGYGAGAAYRQVGHSMGQVSQMALAALAVGGLAFSGVRHLRSGGAQVTRAAQEQG
jgi:membrane-associated protein